MSRILSRFSEMERAMIHFPENDFPATGPFNRRRLLTRTACAAAVVTATGLTGPVRARARIPANFQNGSASMTIASNWPVIEMDPHSIYEGGSAQAMTGQFEATVIEEEPS